MSEENEMTDDPRQPSADGLGRCSVCNGPADHVHRERVEPGPKSHIELAAQQRNEEKNAARRARAAEDKSGDDVITDDDDLVMEVELAPEMVEAMQEAERAERRDDDTPEAQGPEPQDETRKVPARRVTTQARSTTTTTVTKAKK